MVSAVNLLPASALTALNTQHSARHGKEQTLWLRALQRGSWRQTKNSYFFHIHAEHTVLIILFKTKGPWRHSITADLWIHNQHIKLPDFMGIGLSIYKLLFSPSPPAAHEKPSTFKNHKSHRVFVANTVISPELEATQRIVKIAAICTGNLGTLHCSQYEVWGKIPAANLPMWRAALFFITLLWNWKYEPKKTFASLQDAWGSDMSYCNFSYFL